MTFNRAAVIAALVLFALFLHGNRFAYMVGEQAIIVRCDRLTGAVDCAQAFGSSDWQRLPRTVVSYADSVARQ